MLSFVLDGDFPLSQVFLPPSTNDFGAEVKILVKTPLFHCGFDIVEDIRTTGIKALPIWIWVEWKCL